jgi:hypothetical protein
VINLQLLSRTASRRLADYRQFFKKVASLWCQLGLKPLSQCEFLPQSQALIFELIEVSIKNC